MFCTNCGAQVADGSKFCTSCGAQFGAAAPAAPAAPYAPAAGGAVAVAAKKKTKLLPIIIIAAIVVIAAIVLIIVLGGGGGGGASSYEKVISSYFTAFEKSDYEAVSKLLYPGAVDLYKDYLGYDDEDIVDMADPFSNSYGSKVKSWEITDTEEVSKKKLKEMQDEMDQLAELLGKKMKSISAAMTVNVEADIKGEGECDFEFSLVKSGGKWYINEINS